MLWVVRYFLLLLNPYFLTKGIKGLEIYEITEHHILDLQKINP
jgi:hypothetical protein